MNMLVDSMTRHGAFLFRWRSFLPILLVPAFIAAAFQFSYPFHSHVLDLVREGACLALAGFGLVLRALTVGSAPRGTSGRNTTSMKAETLNTTGMYSIVRHPLYFANFIIFLAILIDMGSWWLVLICTLAYWLYYERIMLKEEAFLRERYSEAFVAWAERTPAILPRLRGWTAAETPFSWKRVIRGEYNTIFMVVAVFTAIEIGGDAVLTGELEVEPFWLALFSITAIAYIVVRSLKKWTNVLAMPAVDSGAETDPQPLAK